MPEKYKQPSDIKDAFGVCDDWPAHIVFRSTENIRLLKSALPLDQIINLKDDSVRMKEAVLKGVFAKFAHYIGTALTIPANAYGSTRYSSARCGSWTRPRMWSSATRQTATAEMSSGVRHVMCQIIEDAFS
jgi:hypothetical protein